jgi:EAL domain-containing protein (putative c-di-GMP-specific phosphodiesterase class I)
MAEKTGLIMPVGERVIELVVMQMAQWLQAGLPPVRVAINVSPEQLRRTDVAACLRQHLEARNVPANFIDIEITESAVVEQSAAVQSQLAQIRELGMRLVIDDFGAGHSSLSQLKQLDVDVLKIDQGLIAPLEAGTDAESVCRAIIWMASALNLEVVAEGVETVEQMNVLRNMGCDELQGFLLAEPLPADAMALLLKQPKEMQVSWLYSNET